VKLEPAGDQPTKEQNPLLLSKHHIKLIFLVYF